MTAATAARGFTDGRRAAQNSPETAQTAADREQTRSGRNAQKGANKPQKGTDAQNHNKAYKSPYKGKYKATQGKRTKSTLTHTHNGHILRD